MVMAEAATNIDEHLGVHRAAGGGDVLNTDVGVFPLDWELNELGEVGQSLAGLTYSPADVSADGTLVLRSSNVQNGQLAFENNVFVRMAIPDRAIVRKGDILICVRNGSRELIGKCALIDEKADGMAFGAFMGVFRSDLNDFIFYAFQSEYVQRQIREHLGATINQITSKSLKSFRIALPTNPDEVSAVSEALADADRYVCDLDALIRKKRQIKQGAMQDILSGRRRLPGFAGDWSQVPLASLGEVLNGLTYSPSDISEGGTLVLRSSNIQNDALAFENNVFVKTDIPTQSMVKPNDLLICVRNGSRDLIGKVAQIDERCIGMAFGAFMTVFRTELHDFMLHKFRSGELKKQISERLGATINQITNGDLKSFSVLMPPTKQEAAAIGHVLQEMDREIAVLTQRLSKARMVKQGMMQELLTGRVRLV